MAQLLDFQLMINFLHFEPSKPNKNVFTSMAQNLFKNKFGKLLDSKNIGFGWAMIAMSLRDFTIRKIVYR